MNQRRDLRSVSFISEMFSRFACRFWTYPNSRQSTFFTSEVRWILAFSVYSLLLPISLFCDRDSSTLPHLQQVLYCQNESTSKNKPSSLHDILLKAQYDNKIKSLPRPHFKLFWSFNRGPLVVKLHVTIPNSVVRGIAFFSFQRILQINNLKLFYFTLLHQDVLRTLSVPL